MVTELGGTAGVHETGAGTARGDDDGVDGTGEEVEADGDLPPNVADDDRLAPLLAAAPADDDGEGGEQRSARQRWAARLRSVVGKLFSREGEAVVRVNPLWPVLQAAAVHNRAVAAAARRAGVHLPGLDNGYEDPHGHSVWYEAHAGGDVGYNNHLLLPPPTSATTATTYHLAARGNAAPRYPPPRRVRRPSDVASVDTLTAAVAAPADEARRVAAAAAAAEEAYARSARVRATIDARLAAQQAELLERAIAVEELRHARLLRDAQAAAATTAAGGRVAPPAAAARRRQRYGSRESGGGEPSRAGTVAVTNGGGLPVQPPPVHARVMHFAAHAGAAGNGGGVDPAAAWGPGHHGGGEAAWGEPAYIPVPEPWHGGVPPLRMSSPGFRPPPRPWRGAPWRQDPWAPGGGGGGGGEVGPESGALSLYHGAAALQSPPPPAPPLPPSQAELPPHLRHHVGATTPTAREDAAPTPTGSDGGDVDDFDVPDSASAMPPPEAAVPQLAAAPTRTARYTLPPPRASVVAAGLPPVTHAAFDGSGDGGGVGSLRVVSSTRRDAWPAARW